VAVDKRKSGGAAPLGPPFLLERPPTTHTPPPPPFNTPTNQNTQTQTQQNSIACALYAHFGPGKFPGNASTVAACVCAYALLTAVLGVFSHFREGDSFLITLPKPGHDSGLRVASRMDRHGDGYTLTVSSANKDEDHTAKLETSVANYFHSDGVMAEVKWRAHVRRLLSQYERSSAEAPAQRPRAWDVKRLPPVAKTTARRAAR
jgi:hypothetical protein